MLDKQGNLIHRPKGSIHKPIWLTTNQAYKLYQFLDDFSSEWFKYAGSNNTAIIIALKRAIPERYFED